MQGTSKKHDLSPEDSQLPNKKLRMENSDFDTSGLLGNSFQNSKNYLSSMSPSFNDSSLERTYGSLSNRSSLSRPLGHNEKASERFGPYSMRPSRKHSTPMVIRAKRQIQEDSDPHVTTTAQKIIETLARMSTPVANAHKVPIDSIKPLKPSFTNLRRSIDYGGPPILRSPLVPSSTKIVSSPVINNNVTLRSLPKLVDSATNTEHVNPLEIVTYDDSEKHSGGGKIRRNLHRMHAAPLKNPSAPIANNLGAPSNVNEKSDFNFGSSWSAEEVIEAMAARKEESKATVVETTNKNKDSDSEEESTDSSAPPKKHNIEASLEEISFQRSLKDTRVQHVSLAITPLEPMRQWGPLTIARQSASNLKQIKDSQRSRTKHKLSSWLWSCPSCFASNKDGVQSCATCDGKKSSLPEKTNTLPFVSISLPGASTLAAVASTPLTFTTSSKSKWDCPVCMVPNDQDVPSCVCCSAKNPNAKKVDSVAVTASSVPATTFKFGISATPASSSTFSTTSTASTFTFGAPTTTTLTTKKPESDPAPKTGLTATTKKWTCPTCCVPNELTASSCVCCSEKNPNSTAEITSTDSTTTSATSTPTPQFSFGFGAPKSVPASTSNAAASAAFTGTGSTNPTTMPISAFSMDKKSPPSDPVKPVFGFKTEKLTENVEKDKPNIFAGFQFKALSTPVVTSTPIVSSVSSDSSQEVEIMWKCDICPANNKESVTHCIACDAKRPLKVNKDPPKKFSFAPFSGGRSIGGPPTLNTLQTPKTSIFGGSKPAAEMPGESPKQKRKHSDDNTDTGFQYTAPEPKLKMKAPSEAVIPQPTEIKTGSFLDAMKPQPSNLFGASNTSTLSAPTIPITAPVTTTAAASTPFVFGNTSTSTPAPTFQFGATAPSANTTFSFGSNNVTNKPAAPTSVFGTNTLPVLPNTSMAHPASTPAQSLIPPSVPSFNMTPNVNFGVPVVPGLTSTNNAPPPLFTFQANTAPSEGSAGGGQRKIRKAMRRMK